MPPCSLLPIFRSFFLLLFPVSIPFSDHEGMVFRGRGVCNRLRDLCVYRTYVRYAQVVITLHAWFALPYSHVSCIMMACDD